MNEVVVAQPHKLQVMAGGGVAALIPRTLDEAYRVSEAVYRAGMYPDDCKGATQQETASRILMKVMKGSEVGFPPLTALATILIVNNRVSIWGDGALALVTGNSAYGGRKEWTEGEMNLTEKSNWTAWCSITRIVQGKPVETVRKFSWSDAMRAGLHRKGTYQQYPGRMIQMRARAWCIRDSFADALCGLGIVEEVQDIPQKSEEVSTAFLDSPPQITAPVAAPVPEGAQTASAVDVQPTPEPETPAFDPIDFMKQVRKDFVKAGDDKARLKQIIEAAEGVEMPEPFAAELKELLDLKRGKI